MVYNKSLSHTIRIYDYANNVMYEDADISVNVADEGFDMDSFIEEADQLVKRKVSATPSYGGHTGAYGGYGGGYYGGYDRDDDGLGKPSKPAKKDAAKKEPVKGKAVPKVESPLKGKRGRPPKNASKPANAQMSMSGLVA